MNADLKNYIGSHVIALVYQPGFMELGFYHATILEVVGEYRLKVKLHGAPITVEVHCADCDFNPDKGFDRDTNNQPDQPKE